MRVTKIRYGRTVSINYQSKRVEVEISIDAGESYEDALEAAKDYVHAELGLRDEVSPRGKKNKGEGRFNNLEFNK